MSIFVHPRRETRREQPLEVETSGLLSVLAPGFLEDLMRHGYRPGPAAKQLQVMSHLRPVARRAIWILSHATPPRPGAGRSARAWPEALSFVSYPRAGSYVAINTPVRIVTLSSSWSDASTPREKSLSLERPAISGSHDRKSPAASRRAIGSATERSCDRAEAGDAGTIASAGGIVPVARSLGDRGVGRRRVRLATPLPL